MQEKVLTMTVFYYQVPKMSEMVKNVENISKKGVIYRILSLKKKLFFGKIIYMFYLGYKVQSVVLKLGNRVMG